MVKVACLRHSFYFVIMPYGKELVLFHANSWVLFISWLDMDQTSREVKINKSMWATRLTQGFTRFNSVLERFCKRKSWSRVRWRT